MVLTSPRSFHHAQLDSSIEAPGPWRETRGTYLSEKDLILLQNR